MGYTDNLTNGDPSAPINGAWAVAPETTSGVGGVFGLYPSFSSVGETLGNISGGTHENVVGQIEIFFFQAAEVSNNCFLFQSTLNTALQTLRVQAYASGVTNATSFFIGGFTGSMYQAPTYAKNFGIWMADVPEMADGYWKHMVLRIKDLPTTIGTSPWTMECFFGDTGQPATPAAHALGERPASSFPGGYVRAVPSSGDGVGEGGYAAWPGSFLPFAWTSSFVGNTGVGRSWGIGNRAKTNAAESVENLRSTSWPGGVAEMRCYTQPPSDNETEARRNNYVVGIPHPTADSEGRGSCCNRTEGWATPRAALR